MSVTFDENRLAALGWRITARGKDSDESTATPGSLPMDPTSAWELRTQDAALSGVIGGQIRLDGTFLLARKGHPRYAFGRFVIEPDTAGAWHVGSRSGTPGEPLPVFDLTEVMFDYAADTHRLRFVGEMAVSGAFAAELDDPDSLGAVVGVISMDLEVLPAGRASDPTGTHDDASVAESPRSSSAGPDVIVGRLHEIFSYGEASAFPGIAAFSVGTISCNKGDEPISWYANINQHPVIAQNMYRLKDERFEQIGMSWVKHGFAAIQGNTCDFGCTPSSEGNNELGVGCSDPYSATLNGSQENLGPRSDINPHTGEYPYPWSAPAATTTIHRRIQVNNNDIDPALNPGAQYIVEGHYVTPDDAAAGNQNNNAAYRPIQIAKEAFNFYSAQVTGFTRSEWPALYAWGEFVPGVLRRNIQVPNDGLIIVASRATDLGTGFWHYEYAIQNLNADRGVASFSVPVEAGATVQNVGFHDVDHHSGEPYDGTDWNAEIAGGSITWSTIPYNVDPDANALRWGTMFNFRFDADIPPLEVPVTLGLFKPGAPAEIQTSMVSPVLPPPLCGDGNVQAPEVCDPPDNVLCNGNCQIIVNDGLRGGRLWDRWWVAAEVGEPTGEHPLYPPVGQQTGSATFRCAECHGWDYKGADGAYAAGEHFTGIAGVFGSARTSVEMFNIIKRSDVANGHGFGGYNVSDQDARDLVQFLIDHVIDTDVYVDQAGNFVGNPAAGQTHYETGGAVTCTACHGADGTALNFGTFETPEWVGTTSLNDPWRLLHKTRFGTPGGPMPSWLQSGGSDQGAADIGRYAQENLPAVCTADGQCDDGAFCNGAEACVAGGCERGPNPCPDQPCDEMSDACGVADALRGGLLYDRWWTVLDTAAPVGEHPLYPPVGQQTGSATFRCKECHGWDYKGVAGAYGTGSHFTGINGVFGTTLSPAAMFDLILNDAPPNGHGYANYGLSEQDAWDLVAFLDTLVIDTNVYVDGAGEFLGDPVQGQTNYTAVGSPACVACHGANGAAIDFGTPGSPEWIGTLAVQNPWELLHKIRIGQPGAAMPSWLASGQSDQGAADIGRYAQLNFPVDCLSDTICDDGIFCTGIETCVDGICTAGADPCAGAVCDEALNSCLSGLCEPPLADAAGSRYLAITPQPIGGTDPVRIRVASPTWPCIDRYVGGVSRCDGVGDRCASDADCNRCSVFGDPCLTNQDCSIAAGEVCLVSGQQCIPGGIEPIDLNGDGLADGTLGELVENPDDAAALSPAAWGTSLNRCSKSFDACSVNEDCDRGVCVHHNCAELSCEKPCSMSAQDCLRHCNDFLQHGCQTDEDCEPGVECLIPSCQLDEVCRPGRLYVTGKDIIPSTRFYDGQGFAIEPSTYEVRTDCGVGMTSDLSIAVATDTWLWSDVDHSGAANFADIQFMVLGFQGVLIAGNETPSTLIGGDTIAAAPCMTDQIINFVDIQAAVFAFQDESYAERLDTGICAGDNSTCSIALQDCLDESACISRHLCALPCSP